MTQSPTPGSGSSAVSGLVTPSNPTRLAPKGPYWSFGILIPPRACGLLAAGGFRCLQSLHDYTLRNLCYEIFPYVTAALPSRMGSRFAELCVAAGRFQTQAALVSPQSISARQGVVAVRRLAPEAVEKAVSFPKLLRCQNLSWERWIAPTLRPVPSRRWCGSSPEIGGASTPFGGSDSASISLSSTSSRFCLPFVVAFHWAAGYHHGIR